MELPICRGSKFYNAFYEAVAAVQLDQQLQQQQQQNKRGRDTQWEPRMLR
jgi:7,8-dihydro-6-hydroxymethylpterin-pyrophosphokinase